MGSRILSRSFHVERAEGEEEPSADNEGAGEGNTSFESHKSAMSVDEEDEVPELMPARGEEDREGSESDSEDEDEEDPADVAMVPMADMLNARYGSENVCVPSNSQIYERD